MVTKKRKPLRHYENLVIRVENYSARVSGGVNYELFSRGEKDPSTKVYLNDNNLEITGGCLYPDGRKDARYHVVIYSIEKLHWKNELKLSDCHARDSRGEAKYEKRGSRLTPVYKLPEGVGSISKRRGEDEWDVVVWLARELISDLLVVLGSGKTCYLVIQEVKVQRTRWVRSISLGNL